MNVPTIYILALSIISVVITCYDKWAARYAKRHRTPEKTLFLLSVFGGSAAMFLTMLLIRHKTKHRSFMLGLPAILIVQCIGIALLKTYIKKELSF